MSLAYKPHTVTVNPVSARTSGGTVTGTTYGTSASYRGQLRKLSVESSLKEFGYEVKNPAVFLHDTMATPLKLGDRVTYAGEKWLVRGVIIHDQETITAHVKVLLSDEENQA
jgi:hypothetical protein